ncbi:FimV family protein [Halioglobus sp. HI00S01]|uniref:type IV pilus assembly protein FimV n=2 Tax=Halioglobus sp. HI00S01 TaxID=1822214 RepID=UPI0009EDE8B4|nr:FimV/HubP family polar landmark protein [Halioglobus sp. HI00S01]
MARRIGAVVFSLGCLHASFSYAVGLGDLTLESFLNEPLKAQVEVLNTDGLNEDQIRIRLATREDFDRMGVERAYFLTGIEFDVQFNARGEAVILLSSEDPVLEPYLDFIVEARWPTGRLLREYTVLVDPPLFDASSQVVSASARVEEEEGIPAPDSPEKKTQDPAATSGTRVDVKKKSQLAPGDMPQRDFNAEAAGSPLSGSRYMISRDDTLWEIAAAAKPSGTTIHQTMLDIQRLNPNAFIDGNINRIKAGYIIYLPTEDDISSQDLSTALAEVKQQNEDWEAGRASAPISSGPSLRISADPVEESSATADQSYSPSSSAATDAQVAADMDRAELEGEVEDLEQQVDTLERIVSLKDDQIAALQQALAEAGVDAEDSVDALASDDGLAMEDGMDMADADDSGVVDAGFDDTGSDDVTAVDAATDADDAVSGDDTAADAVEPAVAAEPVAAAPKPEKAIPKSKPAPKPKKEESGLLSYLLYGLGALILAGLAFFFVRRRKADEEPTVTVSAESDKAFAAVELKEQPVEAPVVEETVAEPAPVADEAAAEDGTRGYGERKHDGYASDVDAGDALAEADIYIAYGRYPQAIDLLKTAITSEPANAAYRLKLVELLLQTGDRPAAEAQIAELESMGDAGSAEQARAMLSGTSDDMSEPPAGLAEEVESGVDDFAGLEIEDSLDIDDLDLTSDFDDDVIGDDEDDEDLVIAAEANTMSTKLDLARAYMDMGDEDGARQILEEVVAEGSDEQKTEASGLLERLG